MYSRVKPFLLHAISPVHAGSGSEIGLVDLPIQRETHTGFPKIESSSLKGALRFAIKMGIEAQVHSEEFKQAKEKFYSVFGSHPDDEKQEQNDSQSSAIALSDAKILLFPVRSMRGVFVWITCPKVLRRFNDEMKLNQTGLSSLPVPDSYTVSSKNVLAIDKGNDQRIMLEEYTFSVSVNEDTKKLAKKLTKWVGEDISDLENQLVVLSDDDFTDFVQLSTEVNARIHVSEEGTVTDGALWYEENVPPETVFYSVLYSGRVRGKAVNELETVEQVEAYVLNENNVPAVFQLGGNSTLGRGMLRKIWLSEKGGHTDDQ